MAEGKNISKKWQKYSINDGVLIRKNPFCPQCGPGVFLAIHADRTTCGSCGYADEAVEEEASEAVAEASPADE